ncbi:MAG: ABC transporter permease [Anaerolineae bacterium]|nr:ABC transporter permease [Anaerolineae bacterium]MDK1081338.1 ABC transporter permease [Anaerolineae bacterium]
MKPREVIRIAWEAIIKNTIRSILTMLGVIIGVAAVIIMIAISAGTEATIQDQITSLGSNLVFLRSSFSRGGPGQQGPSGGLVFDDATAIAEGVNGVKAVVVEQGSTQSIKVGNVTLDDLSILGSTPDFPSVRDMDIAQGRYFTQSEVDRTQKVVVLGYSLAQELFGETDPIGQTVTVGTLKMIVIGVLDEKGLVGDIDYDARLYMPIKVVFQKFTNSRFARFRGDRVRLIYVELEEDVELEDVILQIQLLISKRHELPLEEADFTVTTQQDIISTQESTTAAFRSLLAWVAGVSLIVGGIGIMNIMLVSVTERTREIGIRQSVGATPEDIRMQFLTEALLLSIFGGLIGIMVGIGGAYIFGAASGMRTVVVPSSILLAFFSAAIVGVFFGYYPANKAAQLDPIEALRYE